MIEDAPQAPPQLFQAVKQLSNSTSLTESLSRLQQISRLLTDLNVDQIAQTKDFICQCLKPLSREITNYPIRGISEDKQALEEIMLVVVGLYASIAKSRQEVVVFENLEELLERNTGLFDSKASGSMQEQEPASNLSGAQKLGERWKSVERPVRSSKTDFYFTCLDAVLTGLGGVEPDLSARSWSYWKMYMRFLGHYAKYMKRKRIQQLYERLLQANRASIAKLTEASQAKYQSCLELIIITFEESKTILQVAPSQKHETQFRVLFLEYCRALLQSPSKEQKIKALKVMNSQAEELTIHSQPQTSKTAYVRWMVESKSLDLILNEFGSDPALKNCNFIFRLMFKRRFDSNGQAFQKTLDFAAGTNPQNRQFLLKCMQSQSIHMYYDHYEIFLRHLQKHTDPNFYEQQHMNITIDITKYSTSSLTARFTDTIREILVRTYGRFRSERIERKFLSTYGRCVGFLLKGDANEGDKWRIVDQQLALCMREGLSELVVIMMTHLLHERVDCKEAIGNSEIARHFIKNKGILGDCLAFMKNRDNLQSSRSKVEDFVGLLLTYANSGSKSQQLSVTLETLLLAAEFPNIYVKLVDFLDQQADLSGIYENMVCQYHLGAVPFEVVKSIFCKCNSKSIQLAQNQRKCKFIKIKDSASNMKGVEDLKYLLLNAEKIERRAEVADFVAELFTCPEYRTLERIKEQQIAMKQVMMMTLKQYQDQQSKQRLLGYLALVYELMLGTERNGTGKHRAHNALINTTSVEIKIENDIDDASEESFFWKRCNSNMTLQQLLTEVADKFKCDASTITLIENQFQWPDKWNGLTLYQLGIDGRSLKAVKTARNCDSYEVESDLFSGRRQTRKLKRILNNVFKQYSRDQKMSFEQWLTFMKKFPEDVYKLPSSTSEADYRKLFVELDTTSRGYLVMEQFNRMFQPSADPQFASESMALFEKNVRRTLIAVGFGQQITSTNPPEPTDPNPLSFRQLLSQNNTFYEMLLKLCRSEDTQLKQRAQTLLIRLPTYSNIAQTLQQSLQLQSKNAFETEYLLIAIQDALNSVSKSEEERDKRRVSFLKAGNDQKLLEMIARIEGNPTRTYQQTKCLYISVYILRSLLKVPDLKTQLHYYDVFDTNLSLPQTALFTRLIQYSLKNQQIQLLQACLVLDLSQKQNPWRLLLNSGVFHAQALIRKVACNYIFVLVLMDRVEIDLFEVPVSSDNCVQWFQVLNQICCSGKKLDFPAIVSRCLQAINNRLRLIDIYHHDPITQCSLQLMLTISSQASTPCLYPQLQSLCSRLVHSNSRKLLYKLMCHQNQLATMAYLCKLVASVQPIREVQPRNYYSGLKNLGNTCYMNSVLQVLYWHDGFRELVMKQEIGDVIESEVRGRNICDNMVYQLQKMYQYLTYGRRKAFNTEDFCLTVKNGMGEPIDPKLQEDAHEFVGKFLDQMEKFFQNSGKLEQFEDMFEGKTATQVLCQTCKSRIKIQEKFCQISLEVQQLQNLQQSFKKYTSPEVIEDYFCATCEQRVPSIEKSTCLSSLPQLLTINLQRIVFCPHTFMNVKIDTRFEFPFDLDVSNYMLADAADQQCRYRIKAVIIHSGTSESGHYYSLIRMGEQWYKFNDSNVSKFDVRNLAKQAYGGEDATEMRQIKFSTSAYILFYERVTSPAQQMQQEQRLDTKFMKEVQQDNSRFFNQMQVHQDSIFEFAVQLYEKYEPRDLEERMKPIPYEENWRTDLHTPQYELAYSLLVRMLRFGTVFGGTKPGTVFKVGQGIFRLFFLMPEKTYQFLFEFSSDEIVQNLCLHEDENVRNIFKHILGKCMHVFNSYYGIVIESQEQGVVKLLQIVDTLYAFLEDERLSRNVLKSESYFQFWKNSAQFLPVLRTYMNQHEMIAIILDKIMGNSSPIAQKQKKRSQLPQKSVVFLIQTLIYLMSSKRNLKDQLNPSYCFEGIVYEDLTQMQKLMLRSPSLYEKMLRQKLDPELLGVIIARLAYKDLQFSQSMLLVLISAINNEPYRESMQVTINYLRHYLMVDDEHKATRFKWILGIPQYHSDLDLEFGLTYDDTSVVVEYVCSKIFVGTQQKKAYMPILELCYRHRSNFNQEALYYIILLLEFLATSDEALAYVMTLPAPTYLYRSYLDWIPKYLSDLRELAFQKMGSFVISDRMEEVFQKITKKVESLNLDLPVNKSVIGKNKELTAVESVHQDGHKETLWVHETYILPNFPTGDSNEVMPKDLFKFKDPQEYARYFVAIGKEKDLPPTDDIEAAKTLFTFQITADKNLRLRFKLKNFSEQVYVFKGKTNINFLFQDGIEKINQVVQITEIDNTFFSQVSNEDNQKLTDHKDPNKRRKYVEKTVNPVIMTPIPQSSMQQENNIKIQCPVCTLFNRATALRCEACDSTL